MFYILFYYFCQGGTPSFHFPTIMFCIFKCLEKNTLKTWHLSFYVMSIWKNCQEPLLLDHLELVKNYFQNGWLSLGCWFQISILMRKTPLSTISIHSQRLHGLWNICLYSFTPYLWIGKYSIYPMAPGSHGSLLCLKNFQVVNIYQHLSTRPLSGMLNCS